MSRSCTLALGSSAAFGFAGSELGSMSPVNRRYPAPAGEKPSSSPLIASTYASMTRMLLGL